MSARLPVTYWSDPLCIWAYVAQDKLDRLMARYGHRLDLTCRVVPVFGSIEHRFTKGSWRKAGPQGRAAATKDVAHRFGHTEVDGACWTQAGVPASSWAPGLAIEAVAIAEDADHAPEGSTAAYQQALRTAFFVDGANIALRDVQGQVANDVGLDWDLIAAALDDGRAMARLYEDHTERERLGVQGSPTWVFDEGRAMLYGNVSEAVLQATVHELLEGVDAGGSRC